MPFDVPVTTATFPSSFLGMICLSAAQIRAGQIFVSCGKYIRLDSGRQRNYCIGRYETEKPFAGKRKTPLVRLRRGSGPGAAAVLGERLRGNLAVGPDRGDGHQSPQPVCRLREQGSPVPEGARPV